MAVTRTFSDGSFLEFAPGKFDDWCVYLTRPNQERYAPRDEIYFYDLLQFGNVHGAKNIYDDFVSIYERANTDLDEAVFDFIHSIASKYEDDSLEIEILYAILYMGMVAENNKKNTVLKKRVKRLGVHQVLLEGMRPREAANYSKKYLWQKNPQKLAQWQALGKNVPFGKVLDRECASRGF